MLMPATLTNFLFNAKAWRWKNVSINVLQLSRAYISPANDEEDGSADSLPECTSRAEIHRKVVAHAFWNSELEEELRERKWLHVQFSSSGSREDIMEAVDKERSSSVYEHKVCSDECKKRGKFYSLAYSQFMPLHIITVMST